MENQLYWITTLTYAIVLGIVLARDMIVSRKISKLEKSYMVMSAWVIFFCLQDTLWGLCEVNVIKNGEY